MKKIFYIDNSNDTSENALKKVLSDYFNIDNAVILRTKNGKPYMENGPFFSIAHTHNRLYIVVSDMEIGLDCEHRSRSPQYTSIIKKFPLIEQDEILSAETFLMHWVVKESAIKFLGGSIAHDLNKFCYHNQQLSYENKAFPARITLLNHEDYLLCVCGNEDFIEPQFVQVT